MAVLIVAGNNGCAVPGCRTGTLGFLVLVASLNQLAPWSDIQWARILPAFV